MRISGSGHATRGDPPLLPSTIFDLPGGPRDRGGGRVVTGLSSAEGRGGGGGVGGGGGAVTGGGGDSGNDFGFSGSSDRTQLPAQVRSGLSAVRSNCLHTCTRTISTTVQHVWGVMSIYLYICISYGLLCMYVCMCVCVYIFVCMYIYIYICIQCDTYGVSYLSIYLSIYLYRMGCYVCMYVCMYVCTYVCGCVCVCMSI